MGCSTVRGQLVLLLAVALLREGSSVVAFHVSRSSSAQSAPSCRSAQAADGAGEGVTQPRASGEPPPGTGPRAGTPKQAGGAAVSWILDKQRAQLVEKLAKEGYTLQAVRMLPALPRPDPDLVRAILLACLHKRDLSSALFVLRLPNVRPDVHLYTLGLQSCHAAGNWAEVGSSP
jgi:hypothetical protein